MDNQHRKIPGYRELSQAELDLIAKIKAHDSASKALCEEIMATPTGDAETGRWARIGLTHLQQGAMALVRAIALPTQ